MEVLPKLNLTALRKESRLNRWDSSLGGSYYDGDYNSLCCILPAVYFRKVRHNWVYFAEGLVVLTTLAYTGVYVYSASIHEHEGTASSLYRHNFGRSLLHHACSGTTKCVSWKYFRSSLAEPLSKISQYHYFSYSGIFHCCPHNYVFKG